MSYEHEADLDVTLQITHRGVTIFADIECKVHVSYGVDAAIDYVGFEVDWFEFSEYPISRGKRGDLKTVRITKDDLVLYNILFSGLDEERIQETLAENFTFKQDSDSGLCHSPEHVA